MTRPAYLHRTGGGGAACAVALAALAALLGTRPLAAQPPTEGTVGTRWCAEGAALRASGLPFAYDGLARRLPGFAGFAVGGDTLVLRLTDPAGRAAAEAAVRCFAPQAAAARYVAVARARYTFAQLEAWRGRLRESPPPRATTWGVDEAANRLEVGFPSRADFAAGRRALRALGIPARAVSLVVAGPVEDL